MAEITNNGNSEVEVNAKTGLIKVRGSDVLTTFGIAIVCLVGYMVWEHKDESRLVQTQFVSAVKEMASAQKEMTAAQRVQNCLLATKQDEREAKLSTCERISR